MKNNKSKVIVALFVAIVLIILLILLIQNSGKLAKIQNQQLANVGYTTQIGDKTYNITDKIENDIIPTLSAGMIPIKQDGEYWTIINNTDNTWFNYGDGVPAYMMLNDGKYQSEEYYQMPDTKEVAKIGTQIKMDSGELGSIYMWIPRYAYNENGDVIYIKQTSSVAGTYEMPDVFSYETEKEDYALAGIWVECNETTELSSKVEEMNTKDSSYGFIANTKTNVITEEEQTATQILLKNLNALVGASIARPQIDNIKNTNHTVIRIINTNILEPIKAIGYMDEEGDNITIEIKSNTNEIIKVVNSKGKELTKISEGVYTEETKYATKKYIAIDELGNIKELKFPMLYLIETAEDLSKFRDKVNAGGNISGIQVADIDLSSVCGSQVDTDGDGIGDTEISWTPIGISSTPFTGIYNGNNYEIYNLYINKESGGGNSGLFGVIKDAALKNIIAHGNITAINAWSVGGICGSINNSTNNTLITNCVNYINIDAIGNIAGIVGYIGNSNNFKISKCINYGNIIAEQYSSGGIVGCIDTCSNIVIDQCCNYGYLVVKMDNVGGILASTKASTIEITNCYNRGTIKSVRYCAGGIVGNIYRETSTDTASVTIEYCYNTGIVKAIVANNMGAILGTAYTASWYSSQNNYWETNLGYSYGIGSPSANTGTTGVAGTTLKTYASNLGSAYMADPDERNDGYPILKWQVEEIPITAEVEAVGQNVEVKIVNNVNNIVEVKNEQGNPLTLSSNNVYTESATEGNHIYTIVDSEGNEKQVRINLQYINNVDDLVQLRDNVNSGKSYFGVTLLQTADIDLSSVCGSQVDTDEDGVGDTEVSWIPIGTGKKFTGIYNGNNYKIENLYINKASDNYQGLFGIANRVELKNISVNGQITGAINIGGICGYITNNSIIDNCSNYVNITGSSCNGGVIGTITGSPHTTIISNCLNYANITGSSNQNGGIIGTIQNETSVTILKCKNYANVIGNDQEAGILALCNINSNIVIKQCVNKGDITSSTSYSVGGICGLVYNGTILKINDCYNIGKISSKGNVGGIFGSIAHDSVTTPYTIITNCYNAGTVSQVNNRGGIIGYPENTSVYLLTNNYWETGKGASYGIGRYNSNTGATGVSAATLKTYASNLGSAYTNDTTPNINNGYPILRWELE